MTTPRCKWNFYENPSEVPGKCTHLASKSGDEKIVNGCKVRTYNSCEYDHNC